jgi:glutaredoxin-like YruB-family protein
MKKIIIYTLSWCPHCKALKEFLDKNNLKYHNIDVEENSEAAEDIIKRSNQEGFPVLEIDNEIIIGFNKIKLMELLGI